MPKKTLKVAFPEPVSSSVLALLQPQRDSRQGRTGHIASSVAWCPRRDYYDWVEAPRTNPPTLPQLQRMEAGKEAEERFVLRLGKRANILTLQDMSSLEVEGLAYPIHSRLDVVAMVGHPPCVIAYEYKSTEYSATQAVLIAPRLRDMIQLWVYLRAGSEAQHHHLVYQDRGSQIGAEYELIDIDDHLFWRKVPGETWNDTGLEWGSVVEKLRLIELAVAEGIPPARKDTLCGEEFLAYVSKDGLTVQGSMTFTVAEGIKEVRRSHWLCMAYCVYRDHCWLGKEALTEEAKAILEASKKLIKKRPKKKGEYVEIPLLSLPNGRISFDPKRAKEGQDG